MKAADIKTKWMMTIEPTEGSSDWNEPLPGCETKEQAELLAEKIFHEKYTDDVVYNDFYVDLNPNWNNPKKIFSKSELKILKEARKILIRVEKIHTKLPYEEDCNGEVKPLGTVESFEEAARKEAKVLFHESGSAFFM